MKVAYVDCIGGLAGDMLLGALLDAGASRDFIQAQLEALELPGWSLQFKEVERGGAAGHPSRRSCGDNRSSRLLHDP